MEGSEPQALMTRETRVAFGPVPHILAGRDAAEQSWLLDGDQFLLRAGGDHYFHYGRGRGVTIERGTGAEPDTESLWLAGSVHAAIACLNGLVPVHASAVEHGNRVHAFLGASGTGKSTLVAALGQYGLPMFCDDTLVLDPAGHGAVDCLPGHKRLKLAEDALALSGALRREAVGGGAGKFYADPPAGCCDRVLPLARLVMLAEGADFVIEPVNGAARVWHLLGDHYTVDMLSAALGRNAVALFQTMAALARRVDMVRFVRPRDSGLFDEGVRLVADWITGAGDGRAADAHD